METKEFVDVLNGMASKEDIAAINDKLATLEDVKRLIEKPKEEEPVAKMERVGVLDQVMKVDIMGVPIGQAAVGGFIAIFASELVDGFMAASSATTKGLVKLGAAGVTAMWGGKLLGSEGAKIVVLLLAFDAIRDLTPLDAWAAQLADAITGGSPVAGLRGQTAGYGGAVAQATQVARDYYSGLYK